MADSDAFQRKMAFNGLKYLPLKQLFQRLPGVMILSILPSVLLSHRLPFLFAIHYFSIQFLVLMNSVRSAYAMHQAYHSTKYSAVTHWKDKFHQETGQSQSLDQDLHSPCHDILYDHIEHIIIIPNYKEDMSTLVETLTVLSSHSMAKMQYRICLAMEASEADCESKALVLVKRFADAFLDIQYTVHPAGLMGEIRGKSSNVAWAARKMAQILAHSSFSTKIFTVMDADTCFAQDYFMCMTYHYCMASPEQRKIMMFAPPTLFDRNAQHVPVWVRLADMFWSMGVISNLYQESPIKIPCSAYSLSMNLAASVDFWDTNEEAMGEDMHMYLKCFFHTRGRLIVKTVFSPASQCNVLGQEATWYPRHYWNGLTARYTQATRHIWGSLDFGYALRRYIHTCLGLDQGIIQLKNVSVDKLGKEAKAQGLSPWLMLTLFQRLFEAHMILGQFFGILLVTALLGLVNMGLHEMWQLSNPLMTKDDQLSWMIVGSKHSVAFLQAICLVFNIVTFYYYEKYHAFAGFERWALQDVSKADASLGKLAEQDIFQRQNVCISNRLLQTQSLGKRSRLHAYRYWPLCLLDWLAVPVSGLLYGALPMIQVQCMQLFTTTLEYQVATKPTLKEEEEGLFSKVQTKTHEVTLMIASKELTQDEGFYSDEN